jgi:hypothetical protein
VDHIEAAGGTGRGTARSEDTVPTQHVSARGHSTVDVERVAGRTYREAVFAADEASRPVEPLRTETVLGSGPGPAASGSDTPAGTDRATDTSRPETAAGHGRAADDTEAALDGSTYGWGTRKAAASAGDTRIADRRAGLAEDGTATRRFADRAATGRADDRTTGSADRRAGLADHCTPTGLAGT